MNNYTMKIAIAGNENTFTVQANNAIEAVELMTEKEIRITEFPVEYEPTEEEYVADITTTLIYSYLCVGGTFREGMRGISSYEAYQRFISLADRNISYSMYRNLAQKAINKVAEEMLDDFVKKAVSKEITDSEEA